MILSSADCIGKHVETWHPQIKHMTLIRSDIIVKLMLGHVPYVPYDLLEDMGFKYVYKFSAHNELLPKIDAFFFTNRTEDSCTFHDFMGVPYAVSTWGVKWGDGAIENLYKVFKRCPQRALEDRIFSWLQINEILKGKAPKAQKVCIFYDYSRLNEGWEKTSLERSEAAFKEVMQPLGWKCFKLPILANDKSDGYYAHYNPDAADDHLKGIMSELGLNTVQS